MTILDGLKKLIPLSTRRLLKERLPARLVKVVAGHPAVPPGAKDTGQKAASGKGGPTVERPVCPICGTGLAPENVQKPVICIGCGSSPLQRRLALAIYAHVPETARRIVVLGSGASLRSIFDGIGGVIFAESLAQISPDLHGHTDLCVHSNWFPANPLRMKGALKEIDALLSPNGKQIVTINASAGAWRLARWRFSDQALIQRLRREGWAEPASFEPSEFYGEGAGAIFGCSSTEEATERVIILSKL